MTASVSRPPQQERGRASLDRMLEAAERLLLERSGGDLTILEVSAAAAVPVGSIYYRFRDKDELIDATQQRIAARLYDEHRAIMARLAATTGLQQRLAHLIDEVADFLRTEADAIRVISVARNPQSEPRGTQLQADLTQLMEAAILQFRAEILHPDAETAVDMAVRLIFGTLTRQIGLGRRNRPDTDPADWSVLKDYVGQACAGLLERRAGSLRR